MDTDELNQLRQAAALKLSIQSARVAGFAAYAENEAGIIALLDTEERQTFRTFLAESGCNWAELIVNAVAERLQVTGFRFGSEADNELAWTIWQANCLDADSELVQTDALTMGSSYLLVQPDDTNPAGVSITPESPYQATVLYDPGSRRRRVAGYKRYGAATDYALNDWALINQGQLTAGSVVEVLVTPEEIVTWWPDSGDSPQVDPNPVGAVSMVEVVPQPRTLGPPRCEFEGVIPVLDRLNTSTFNLMVSADYGAFRQVWASGVKIARQVVHNATDGTDTVVAVRPFDIGANRLLASENPDARFGSFPEALLTGYLSAIEQDVVHLAAMTQTPAHYLMGKMINLAADAIKAAEVGLVAKTRRRSVHIGEAYEEAMRLALGIVGSPAAANVEAETVWADMETRSEGQRVDALVKMATLGVPREVLWAKWGASPAEIQAWQEMIAADPGQEVTPPPAPAPPVPSPVPPPEPQPAP